jgi:hypothetical protein
VNLLHVRDAEIPGLDVRVVRLGVETLGDLNATLQEALRVGEDGFGAAIHLMLVQRGMMGESMRDEILERLQEDAGELLLIIFWHLVQGAGHLEGFATLGVADLGEDKTSDRGCVETEFDRHDENAGAAVMEWNQASTVECHFRPPREASLGRKQFLTSKDRAEKYQQKSSSQQLS